MQRWGGERVNELLGYHTAGEERRDKGEGHVSIAKLVPTISIVGL